MISAPVNVCGQKPRTVGCETGCWQHSRWMEAERRLNTLKYWFKKLKATAGHGLHLDNTCSSVKKFNPCICSKSYRVISFEWKRFRWVPPQDCIYIDPLILHIANRSGHIYLYIYVHIEIYTYRDLLSAILYLAGCLYYFKSLKKQLTRTWRFFFHSTTMSSVSLALYSLSQPVSQ